MEVLQNIIVYAILGAIQGFSEPIPISSSGHLVIFKNIFEHFGWNFPTTDITFEVLVNTGSLLAIMFYYRKDIARLFMSFFGYMFKAEKRDELLPDFRYCMLLIVATIPAAIGGVLFNDYIETALLPGISRSGSTITGGMLGGLEQKTARDFSFFMFMPVSLGAIILKIKDFVASPTLATLWLPYLIAFIVSGIVTYLALQLLFSFLNKRKMNYFSIYCFVMGLFALIVL